MDVFIAFLVLSAIACIFVLLVRRSNAQARALSDSQQYKKPELLTSSQRKALNLPQVPLSAGPVTKSIPEQKTKPAASRAIRTGWSIGVIAFTYEDSLGGVSYRIVTVHSVGSVYLKGECHEKKAERTFRMDRILGQLTDCATGEILSPTDWLRKQV